MTTKDVVREMRRLLGEALVTLGDASPIYKDEFLLEHLDGVAEKLAANGVMTVRYQVDFNELDSNDDPIEPSITPEPDALDGLILAAHAVCEILSGDLSEKVRQGDLGVRFKSGIEDISTVEASRRIAEVVTKALEDARYWTIIKLSRNRTFLTRPQ